MKKILLNAAFLCSVIGSYAQTGELDPMFGTGGIVTTTALLPGATVYNSSVVQSDGKLVAAGYTNNGTNDFAIVRYNVNGTPDNSFSGDGVITVSLSAGNDVINAVVIQADGKILVTGNAGNDIALARFNTDGSPDNSFDGDGVVITDFGGADTARAIAVQSDGKIVIGGTAVVRYNTNGSIDNSFDGDGRLNGTYNCGAIAIQNDGKILVVNNEISRATVWRFNSNGTVDTGFGESGTGSTSMQDEAVSTNYTGRAIAIQGDGKIVIVGDYAIRDLGVSVFMLVRLDLNGIFDDNFYGHGQTYRTITEKDTCTSVAIQQDGKIILGGHSLIDGSRAFVLVRYMSDGDDDLSFSEDATQITQLGNGYDALNSIVISGDKLYAVGYSDNSGFAGAVARYSLCSPGDPGCGAPATCAASGTQNNRGYINRVFFRSIANESGWNNGYGNFQSLTASVKRTASYTMTIVPGFTGFSGFTLYTRAWADWNQDGDFDDAGELIFAPAASSKTVSGMTIAIPSNAKFGKTKLRLAMRQGTAPTACGTFDYGEVEDYTLQVEQTYSRPGRSDNEEENTNVFTNVARYNVFPNPVSGNLIIQRTDIANSAINTMLSITDAAGRLVMNKKLNNSLDQVDVSKLNNGVYFLRLQNGNEIKVEKVIVKH
ncbi:MAG: GEVED domain-containing protein [Ferruginibacter sp.]